MEILNFLNFKFEDLHKAKKPGFGKLFEPKGRQSRAAERRKTREQARQTDLFKRRNIQNMEPLTPEPPKPVKPTRLRREDLLKQWKKDKEEKLKKEKEKKKPIFKVGGAFNVGFPTAETKSFAPKNAGFTAPAKVKQIQMNLPQSKKFTASYLNINEPMSTVKQNKTQEPIASVSKAKDKNQKFTASSSKKVTLSVSKVKDRNPIASASKTMTSSVSKAKDKPKVTSDKRLENTDNRFLRVTRSQKPVLSPPLPLPGRKTTKKTDVLASRILKTPGQGTLKKAKEAIKTVIKNEKIKPKIDTGLKKITKPSAGEKVTVQTHSRNNEVRFALTLDENDKKSKISYEKTPKLIRQNALNDSNGDTLKNIPNHSPELSESDKITPKRRRKSLRTKQVLLENITPDKSKVIIKSGRKSGSKRKSLNKENIEEYIDNKREADVKEIRKSRNSSVFEINTVLNKSVEVSSPNLEEKEVNSEVENSGQKKVRKSTRNMKRKNTPRIAVTSASEEITSTEENDTKDELNVSNTSLKKERKSPRTKQKLNPDISDASSTLSTSYSFQSENDISSSVYKTPENVPDSTSSIYISPFVTTSRGKGSKKKENKNRKSLGFAPFGEHTSEEKNQAGTAYFHKVLDNVIERLLADCDFWNGYKKNGEATEEACDMIDVAVGQTHLLINKKLQQFRNLIIDCEKGNGEGPVTVDDLQGFWDMVYIQVDNVDLRFKRLTDMKANNWEEIKSAERKKPPVKKRPLVKAKSTTSARSNIREMIKAARQKTLQVKEAKIDETVFNGGFFVVKSPNKHTPNAKTPNKKRKSLLTTVLSTEAKKKARQSASGLTVLRLSQSFKTVAKGDNLNQTLPTPGRSILKKERSSKAHNISKVVLFKDENSEYEDENDPVQNIVD